MKAEAIKELIESIMQGGAVTAEVVKLAPGQTIDDIIAQKGYKPVGEKCEGCAHHHEYENAEGQRVVLIPADDAEEGHEPTEEQVAEFKKRRAKAIEGIQRRQALALRIYDLLRDMEKSIALDINERDPKDLFKEITMYAEIQALKERL